MTRRTGPNRVAARSAADGDPTEAPRAGSARAGTSRCRRRPRWWTRSGWSGRRWRSLHYRCLCYALVKVPAGRPGGTGQGRPIELETARLLIDLMWSVAEGAELQVAALLIGEDGRAYGDQPLVDRTRPEGLSGAIQYAGHDRTERGWRDRLLLDLVSVPSRLARVLVTAALDDSTPASLGAVQGMEVVVGTPRAGGRPVRFVLPPLDAERALVAVEIYRRGGRWRVRAVAQGYAEGAAAWAAASVRRWALTRSPARSSSPGSLVDRSTNKGVWWYCSRSSLRRQPCPSPALTTPSFTSVTWSGASSSTAV